MNNIVIGLGGIGGHIINKLKHKIYKKDDIPVECLYIDSNFDLIDRDEHLWRAFGKDISLGANNTYRLTSNHLGGVFDFKHNKVSSRYSSWIGSIENWRDLEVQLQGGYGVVYGNQRRRLGRLLLAGHIDNILNRVNFLVQGLQRKTRSNRNIFHICTGLSGGTGSGSFIDILIQLKKIYQGSNNEFVLYLYLPEDNPHSGKLNGGNYFANVYASLKELNALYTRNWKPWDISRLNKKIDIGSNNSFLATTHLITNTNGYHSILEVDKMQPEEMIADFISLGLTNNSFHRSLFGIENSFTRDEYKNAQPLRSRNFFSFGIKRIIYPKDEIFEYMNYKIFYHVILALIYNKWDEKEGYIKDKSIQKVNILTSKLLKEFRLAPEYLLLSKGILENEQSWKNFEDEWIQYIEGYAKNASEKRGLRDKEIIENLLLNCEKKYNSLYRKVGVEVFFEEARFDTIDRRIFYISNHIQNYLLVQWLQGAISLPQIELLIDKIIKHLNHQQDDFKKKNDVLGLKIEQSKLDIDFWKSKLDKAYLFTKKEYKNVISALKSYYIYKTYQEAYSYSLDFSNILISVIEDRKGNYISLVENLKRISNNLEVNYNIRLENNNDIIEKVYDKEQIDSLLNTMILKNKDIMDSFKDSTKSLIEGKEDFSSLSKIVESRNFIINMESTIDSKFHNILKDIANTQPRNDILNKNIINELEKKYSNSQKEFDMNNLLNESKFYLPFDYQELNKGVDNNKVLASNQSINYILYPNGSSKKDFLRFSMKANQNSQPRNDGLNNELTIINIQPSFPLRYIAKLKRLAHNYEVRYENNKQGDMDIQLHIEGSKDDYPDLFIEDISYPKEKSILDEDKNIFNENFISELVLDDEKIEVVDFEGKVVDVFSSKVDILQNTSLSGSSRDLVYDVFISHHSHDTEIATQLYNYLKDKRLKVFLPRISMKSGEEWVDKMNNALRNSKVFIAIGSKKEYMESPWVKKERTDFEVLRQVDTSKALYGYIISPMILSELPDDIIQFECFEHSKPNEFERLYRFVSNHLLKNSP